MSISKYWKSVAAFIGVAAGYLYQYNAAHPNHWVSLVLGVLTVLGVYQVKNAGV